MSNNLFKINQNPKSKDVHAFSAHATTKHDASEAYLLIECFGNFEVFERFNFGHSVRPFVTVRACISDVRGMSW